MDNEIIIPISNKFDVLRGYETEKPDIIPAIAQWATSAIEPESPTASTQDVTPLPWTEITTTPPSEPDITTTTTQHMTTTTVPETGILPSPTSPPNAITTNHKAESTSSTSTINPIALARARAAKLPSWDVCAHPYDPTDPDGLKIIYDPERPLWTVKDEKRSRARVERWLDAVVMGHDRMEGVMGGLLGRVLNDRAWREVDRITREDCGKAEQEEYERIGRNWCWVCEEWEDAREKRGWMERGWSGKWVEVEGHRDELWVKKSEWGCEEVERVQIIRGGW
ncbi:hypothetical protein GLAREA_10555 [Glarea lozoyensis ATCC 20868]|uniref:Uncharacterized protein n=1 Tax=Glarea lozoyensis (strain ATCC 20868 / MF5171) TaxID=1116229 RepID=S3DAX2_GLAL2|nr:uncharacterized protein GLAREA_10555 [Glarea lozoyensis ATCC 20868]EPE34860.1 hypothetical protein GLAREA_10555 [Glarea lozoyensis ATCC 20868]